MFGPLSGDGCHVCGGAGCGVTAITFRTPGAQNRRDQSIPQQSLYYVYNKKYNIFNDLYILYNIYDP